MNAMLDHRPIIMIAKTGTPPRYIAIAAPARMEWVPTSCCWMRRLSSPMATTPSRRADSMCLLVMWAIRFRTKTVDTGVEGVVFGYVHIRLTIAAHWMTGQRVAWSVRHWVMVSFLRPFFWETNVMETRSAEHSNVGVECWSSTSSL